MSPETLELTLEGMAYGGEAFGRDAGGRMIFIRFAAPRERVRVRLTELHQRWARAELIEILEASPDRLPPRCRHFGECGGCNYQHLSYSAQVESKTDIVRSQLSRLGGFFDPPVQVTVPSPSPWNTRNHVQFSLSPAGRLGFQAAGSHRVVPIEECHLPEPALGELWPRIDLEPIAGLTRIGVRAGTEGEAMIILESDGPPDVEVDLDVGASVVWLGPAQTSVLAGSGHLTMGVLGRPFRVSAESFFQVHTALAGELVRHVLEAVQAQPGKVVFDVYAGVGLFSAFLAQAGARVVAVEQSDSACRDFEVNLDEFETVELYAAPVEMALPALDLRPDAVIVDPPRTGLGTDVVQWLVDLSPDRVVYVSCDPSTLARDGQRLAKAGFELRSVTPFDLFPQTFHIETVSVWGRQTGTS